MANQGLPGLKGLLAPKDLQATKDLKDFQAIKDLKDLQAIKDLRDLKDFQAIKDLKDLQAIKDLKDLQAIKDLRDRKDLQAIKDLRDRKDLQDLEDPETDQGDRNLPSSKPREIAPLWSRFTMLRAGNPGRIGPSGSAPPPSANGTVSPPTPAAA